MIYNVFRLFFVLFFVLLSPETIYSFTYTRIFDSVNENVHKESDNSENIFNDNKIVYLTPKILKGKNTLTQDMLSRPNTHYIIQHDYDLNDSEIIIPENCLLDFQGGSFINGIIKGKVLNEFLRPEWFGAKGDGVTDDTDAIQRTIDIANKSETLVVLKNSYAIYRPLVIGTNTHISGGFDRTNTVISPIITQNGECDIMTLNNNRFNKSSYYFDIHISNIKLHHKIDKSFNAISLDELSQNVINSTILNTKFEYIRISNCRAGIAIKWNSKGGFLYNYWNNIYVDNSNIGMLFEAAINKETNRRYSCYVNLNTFDNCYLSKLTNSGIFVRIGSSFTSNSIKNCSFESIGNNGVDNELYKVYGCNAIAVLAASNGINTINNNYIENIYPSISSEDIIFTKDYKTNFLCACIVLAGSGLKVDANYFNLYTKGINVSCHYTSLFTKDNGLRNSSKYMNKGYFVEFYNETYMPDPLYNQFVFEDIVFSPSESFLNKYFKFEKESIYNVYQVNIVDKTNLAQQTNLNYNVRNRKSDALTLYVGNTTNGNGLHNDSPILLNSAFAVSLYKNTERLTLNLVENLIIANFNDNINNDILVINGNGHDIQFENFYSSIQSKEIIFENVNFYWKGTTAFKVNDNTRRVTFKNCTINYEGNIGFISIGLGERKTISFETCTININRDTDALIAMSNTTNCKMYFIDTYTPDNLVVSDCSILNKSNPNISGDSQDPIIRYYSHRDNIHFRYGTLDKEIQTVNSGLFENKPKNPSVGTLYFCTDRQTAEGATDGIVIYHKGGNIWVDALGRIVK